MGGSQTDTSNISIQPSARPARKTRPVSLTTVGKIRKKMKISENEFRDLLYANYKDNLSSLIIGRKEPIEWVEDEFPPIHFLLQQRAEKKINAILDSLESLILAAKEMRLEKEGDSTTRIDLFGNSEDTGLTVIELKKSKQTERQAFTELLAYANHFCSIFPGLKETSITSILVAPMETRTVRDAYVQELVANNKNTLALMPEEEHGQIKLRAYYPDKSYYQWFENNMLDDRSMLTVAVSFPAIEGWIDTDFNSGSHEIPDYSRKALNTISSTISHKLEACGIHSLIYASQKWGEIAQVLTYPNTIFVVAINPFAAFRTSVHEDNVYGESENGRLDDVQSIHDQLSDDEKEFWVETMESNFHNSLIKIVRKEFELCFLNKDNTRIAKEISLPDWYGIKTSMVDGVCTHNLDIFLTGLLREVYLEYVKHVYETNDDCIFYYDDLPKYSYKMFRGFLPVWEILRGLGIGDEDEAEES